MNSTKREGNKPGKRFSIDNRKYLGSKRELAATIQKHMQDTSGTPEVFFDAFLGTGAVSAALIRAGVRKVIACDNLLSNTVIFQGAFAQPGDETEVGLLLERLNGLPGRAGYVTAHFADSYFTRPNCLRMDAIREEIDSLKNRRAVSEDVLSTLLASFLLAADRAANTLGQYDAFLKNLGRPGYAGGRHIVDVRVYEEFRLRPLDSLPDVERAVHTDDVFRILDGVEADAAYLDPPYNSRQYCDNYHLLENLARWRKPPVAGKTKKFARDGLKSPFSRKREAGPALERLLRRLKAKHVYLSYNSEGILSKEDIQSIIAPYGSQKLWEIPYPVFGKGAGVSRKRTVIEYLFYFRKN